MVTNRNRRVRVTARYPNCAGALVACNLSATMLKPTACLRQVMRRKLSAGLPMRSPRRALGAAGGAHDRNFKVTAADGSRYLFKIRPPAPDSAGRAPGRGAASSGAERAGLPLPRLFLGRDGSAFPPFGMRPGGSGTCA